MPCVLRRMERDAQFAQRKAERATVRSHFRDKYRLPKVRLRWEWGAQGQPSSGWSSGVRGRDKDPLGWLAFEL